MCGLTLISMIIKYVKYLRENCLLKVDILLMFGFNTIFKVIVINCFFILLAKLILRKFNEEISLCFMILQ